MNLKNIYLEIGKMTNVTTYKYTKLLRKIRNQKGSLPKDWQISRTGEGKEIGKYQEQGRGRS